MEKTKKVLFGEILAIEEIAKNEELVKFVKHELELLNKKAGSKKPTKVQEENEKIKVQILEVLEVIDKPMQIKELQAKFQELAGYSNQKISALLKQLVEDGKVEKISEKRETKFSLFQEKEIDENAEESAENDENFVENDESDEEIQQDEQENEEIEEDFVQNDEIEEENEEIDE